MKSPKYYATNPQQMSDIGLNPFAAQLLAESFADKPDKFGDENALIVARAHNDQPVFMLLSKTPFKDTDFSQENSHAEKDAE